MNLPTRMAHNVATNPWIVLLCSFIAISTFLNAIYDKYFSTQSSTWAVTYAVVGGGIYLILTIYAMNILEENKRLQEIANSFREINSIYRDSLFRAFYGSNPVTEEDELRQLEKETLTPVCQRISQIFTKLTRRQCIVSVKLLTKKSDVVYAKAYTRSENSSERDKSTPKEFKVGTGENTAFDEALRQTTTGELSFFYSGDLGKHKNYFNERQNYLKYYKSAIVVPIRCLGVEGKAEREDVGLLCVDTRSRNRLNNGHHVVMLSSLADQMYNFMSLMRGKYSVRGVKGEDVKGNTGGDND